MEYHQLQLDKHCRVCAQQLQKYRLKYECGKCTEELAQFGVNTALDSKVVHPSHLCHLCYVTAKNILNGKTKYTTTVPFDWTSHTQTACKVCEKFQTQVGRPKKSRKMRGRPSPNSKLSLLHQIQKITPPAPHAHTQLLYNLSSCPVNPALIKCCVCDEVLRQPLQLHCSALLCSSCLKRWIETSDNSHCPCCYSDGPLLVSMIHSPPEAIMELIRSVPLTCSVCCQAVLSSELDKHLSSGCQQYIFCKPASVMDVASESLETPVQQVELQAAGNILRRYRHSNAGSPVDNILRVPSSGGGKPLTVMVVPQGCTPTSRASMKTIARRNKVLGQVRGIVSGNDSSEQLQHELRRLGKEERQHLLHREGITINIPPEAGVAMKADLAIPWTKLRVIKRWLKEWGVCVSSERRLRHRANTLVGENLEAEEVPFTFSLKSGGEEIRAAPMAYVPDLLAKVFELLDANEEVNRTTTHNSVIPEDEVWVKIGGDKGGGTMKLNFQICNVKAPNSTQNTCVFAMFEAPDSATNVHLVLERYNDQVSQLASAQWRGKRFRLFPCGDYQFLCLLYGISGASGKHCCLWCEVPSVALKVPPEQRPAHPARTLAGLRADHARFVASGSDIRKAKLFNNVIYSPKFDIEIDQVCLPGLHISLGIFQRLFDLMEQECHDLDLLLAACQNKRLPSDTTPAFDHFAATYADIHNTREELDTQRQHSDFLDQALTLLAMNIPESQQEGNSQLEVIRQEARACRQKIGQLESRLQQLEHSIHDGVSVEAGPFVRTLEKALKTFNVERRAYWSGSFVGNHVHRTLKTQNTEALCQAVVTEAECICPELVPQAKSLSDKFQEAFTLFARCHNLYNSGAMSEETLDAGIKNFMQFYRTRFPHSTVTPKMHFLESHMLTWMEKWKVGFGMMGEQGFESVHHNFNEIQKSYQNMPNPVERMKRVMFEHFIRISPSNVRLEPAIKRRKLNMREE